MEVSGISQPLYFQPQFNQPEDKAADGNDIEKSKNEAAEPQRQLSPVNTTEASNPAENKSSQQDRQGQPDPAEQLRLAEQIRSLAKRDKEVKTHERIHASLAGVFGGPPQFQFQRGPDGVLYAVAGHVSIDASPIAGDPEATIRKAQIIKRAALGPADPSSADRAVAARANAMQTRAIGELAKLVALRIENQEPEPGSLVSDVV